MAHVCERYFTNTKDVEITDRLCEGVLKTMIEESPKVIRNLEDYEARANIMWAEWLPIITFAELAADRTGAATVLNTNFPPFTMLHTELGLLSSCLHG